MYMIPNNIAVAICSKYSETRTPFLRKILSQIPRYSKKFHILLLSDNNNYDKFLTTLGYPLKVNIIVTKDSSLPSPFHLPWTALTGFQILLKRDSSITHFLYMEDDLSISPELVHFLTYHMEQIRHYGFFPGALRVEQTTDETSTRRPLGRWYSTDQTRSVVLNRHPVFETPDWYFTPMINAHQGFYFHTREQMQRLFALGTSVPFFNSAGLPDTGLPREHAAAGLTWDMIPKGWPHRLLVPVCKTTYQIPSICHVHHMTNHYGNGHAYWGQLPVEDVIKVE